MNFPLWTLTVIWLWCSGVLSYSLLPSQMYKGVGYSGFRSHGPESTHQEIMTAENIAEDMAILQNAGVKWVRTYATDLNGDLIPSIAKDHGIDTIIGTWVSKGDEGLAFWYKEVQRVEELLKKDSRLAPIIIVGNEVIYEKIQPPEKVQEMLNYAKSKGLLTVVGDIPPVLLDDKLRPIFSLADILMMHTHPYFSNTRTSDGQIVPKTRLMPDASAANDVVEATLKLKSQFPDKLILVGETGYPSEDDSPYGMPTRCRWCNEENQKAFFANLFFYSQSRGLGVFAFGAFDEDWKGRNTEEDGSGPHWGIWRSDRSPKPAVSILTRWLQTDGPISVDREADICDIVLTQSECVPKESASDDDVKAQLTWACGDQGGRVDCSPIDNVPGFKECPLRVKAAWAFNRFFHQQYLAETSCGFSGVGTIKASVVTELHSPKPALRVTPPTGATSRKSSTISTFTFTPSTSPRGSSQRRAVTTTLLVLCGVVAFVMVILGIATGRTYRVLRAQPLAFSLDAMSLVRGGGKLPSSTTGAGDGDVMLEAWESDGLLPYGTAASSSAKIPFARLP